MPAKQKTQLLNYLQQNRFAILLIGLVLLFFYVTIIPAFPSQFQSIANRMGVGLLLTFLVFAATAAVYKKTSRTALWLGIPAIFLEVLDLWLLRVDTQILSHALRMLFIGYVVFQLLKFIFIGRQVSANTIFASLCVYLLLATLWAYAYSLLELFNPDAFSYSLLNDTHERIMRLGDEPAGIEFYYSLVTMTTLGYGDIVPTAPESRSLAALQAVTGQLYLTVIVARLVGLHVAEAADARD